jgi:hypothetical protein|tara:strand:- start:672 stop:890 length:219 start_codon:yes stop_codon:yes gene_type:complete
MNLEAAIRASVREYYTGNLPLEFMEQFPDMKHTPEYFIKLEDDIMEDTKGDDAGERLDDEMLEEEGMDNGKP